MDIFEQTNKPDILASNLQLQQTSHHTKHYNTKPPAIKKVNSTDKSSLENIDKVRLCHLMSLMTT